MFLFSNVRVRLLDLKPEKHVRNLNEIFYLMKCSNILNKISEIQHPPSTYVFLLQFFIILI